MSDLTILSSKESKNFWSKVSKPANPDGCWTWGGSLHKKGYGLWGFRGKIHKAHRISYRIHKGRIPDGLCVCHACDNPPCVNPKHLWVGTHQDNADDKYEKGRDNHAKGEANGGGGKLTWESVREIRRLREEENMSQQTLADKFGVSQPMIGLIVRGEKWIEE